MKTLALPLHSKPALRQHKGDSKPYPRPPARPRLLVFTDDEPFWKRLLNAATKTAGRLIRKRKATDPTHTLRVLQPSAVLLDLDLPGESAWHTVDLLLRDANSPPLLLLTSRSDQMNFQTAIQSGSLIDKGEDPTRILRLAASTLESSIQTDRKRNAIQGLIRWLKPCPWPAQVAPMRRFWGINE